MVDLSVVLCITSIPVNTEITGHDRRLTTWHSDPQTKQLEPGAFNHQPILGVFSSYRWISNSTRLDTFCTQKKQNTPFTATVISLCDCSLQVSDLNTTYDWKCTVSVHRLHFQLSRKKKKHHRKQVLSQCNYCGSTTGIYPVNHFLFFSKASGWIMQMCLTYWIFLLYLHKWQCNNMMLLPHTGK